jgi:hypothetical protein
VKFIKTVLGLIVSIILGLLMGGVFDLEYLKVKRNIKLKKESWFRELSENGIYYERINNSHEIHDYLLQENIVEKVRKDENEKSHLISLIKQ